MLDFGIVRDVADSKVTAPGQVLGSVAYMALEQALGTTVDARADVYSLGVVMYQMLTGTNPFDKGSYNTSLIAVYTEHPPPVVDVVPGVPVGLSAFVARLMRKERDQRPKDAAEALGELEATERVNPASAASTAPAQASKADQVTAVPSARAHSVLPSHPPRKQAPRPAANQPNYTMTGRRRNTRLRHATKILFTIIFCYIYDFYR